MAHMSVGLVGPTCDPCGWVLWVRCGGSGLSFESLFVGLASQFGYQVDVWIPHFTWIQTHSYLRSKNDTYTRQNFNAS
jgi:hypothetical protein